MSRFGLLLALLAGIGIASTQLDAQDKGSKKSKNEPTEYRMEQKVEYKEIEHPICKMVPDKRSKWVYCTRPDYYCIPPCPIHCPWHHHDDCCCCEQCLQCKGPYCRPALYKKQVEWECGMKCVVEMKKEKVPVLVWRKVPLKEEKKRPTAPKKRPDSPTPGSRAPRGKPFLRPLRCRGIARESPPRRRNSGKQAKGKRPRSFRSEVFSVRGAGTGRGSFVS